MTFRKRLEVLAMKFFYEYWERRGIFHLLLGPEDAAVIFNGGSSRTIVAPAQVGSAMGYLNTTWAQACVIAGKDPTGLTCMREAFQDAGTQICPHLVNQLDATWASPAVLKVRYENPREPT